MKIDEYMNTLNKEITTSGKILQDRSRPYDGQSHTDQGIRGMTEVKGITMRDIADCLRIALWESCPHGESAKSVYDLDIGKCDPVAIEQNLTCNIEKMMGIFPNLPKTT